MSDQIEPFLIATLTLGKARLGIARLPGRAGDLAGDIGAIEGWGARLVLSMTEPAELTRHGAGDLARLLSDRGIAHRAFPIPDFGTPEHGKTDWPPLARGLHARLDAGDALLLHCMGGKGRSGMVALRLLVERGMEPEAALRLIRQVRPGAVETPAQEAWGMNAN